MARSKPKSSAGGKEAGAAADVKSTPKKAERTALSSGISYPVERSFYDPQQDCVIDVLRVEKIVRDRKGNDTTVTIYRHEYCKDEDIQAKYRRQPDAQVEVTDVE